MLERTCQEERGIQKTDQGKEEQIQEGVRSWPQNCPTQGQEERRLNIISCALWGRSLSVGCVWVRISCYQVRVVYCRLGRYS